MPPLAAYEHTADVYIRLFVTKTESECIPWRWRKKQLSSDSTSSVNSTILLL